MAPSRSAFFRKVEARARELGLWRVHPDATEPVARAVLEALAGLPAFEQLHAGDLRAGLTVLALVSGERVPGVEVARRAQLLHERLAGLAERRGGLISALQLVAYERAVPQEERGFVLSQARCVPLFFGRSRVASWVAALAEPAVYAKRLPGWPPELAAPALNELAANSQA